MRDPEAAEAAFAPLAAQAEGVFFTRDLVSEPANVLTTTEFAERLDGLRDLGVEVEVLDEAELEAARDAHAARRRRRARRARRRWW